MGFAEARPIDVETSSLVLYYYSDDGDALRWINVSSASHQTSLHSPDSRSLVLRSESHSHSPVADVWNWNGT